MLEHKDIFDQISKKCSEIITRSYSTSFSFAIKLLDKKIQSEIHSIYGYVRLGDEIVDSFHSFNKIELLSEFKQETFKSIKNKISLNPVINNFQRTVNKYEIDHKLIKGFIKSMEFDLNKKSYNNNNLFNEKVEKIAAKVLKSESAFSVIDKDKQILGSLSKKEIIKALFTDNQNE